MAHANVLVALRAPCGRSMTSSKPRAGPQHRTGDGIVAVNRIVGVVPTAILAEASHRHGGSPRDGEIILTGTCTGITKVSAGQTFDGCFADFSPVQVNLV